MEEPIKFLHFHFALVQTGSHVRRVLASHGREAEADGRFELSPTASAGGTTPREPEGPAPCHQGKREEEEGNPYVVDAGPMFLCPHAFLGKAPAMDRNSQTPGGPK